jgi:hypothetical protein
MITVMLVNSVFHDSLPILAGRVVCIVFIVGVHVERVLRGCTAVVCRITKLVK